MKTKREHLERLLNALHEKGEFNGALLVAEGGTILAEAAFGTADWASGRKLTVQSVFELASVSKPFTAAAIMILAEQGKLHYDDGIERWLPDFPYTGITVRHLLTHTSGLPDYMELFLNHWDSRRIACNEDVLRLLETHKPEPYFLPNEQWQYSNTGYVLLAVIVERASGRSFADFMRDFVFIPQGMDDSRVYNRRYRPETIADYAFGYVYDARTGEYALPDEMAETSYVHYLDGIQGDGTVNSNVRDLYRFDQALYGEGLVGQESLQEAFAPVRLNDGETFGYGFGWIVEQREGKGKIVCHGGSWPGYSTSLIRYVDSGKTLIYLSNMEQDYNFDQQVIEAAERILFDEPYDIPARGPRKRAVEIDPGVYASYAGRYRFADGPGAAISAEENRLYLQVDGQVRLELLPSSENTFFLRSLPVEVTFIVESAGLAEAFILNQDGVEQQATRE
ncbi:serine hydrolase [Paenibacillus hodogayensis]|uniref:Serine hydrolase n=1 Tax=Paenibacillus hodogayensis TaxID=279208 RepID=A0ABV5VPP0_9BACL